MLQVPCDKPVTTPVPDRLRIVGQLELQVPPAVASLSGNDDPTQTDVPPRIAVGNGFTVTIAVVKQVVGSA